MMDKQKKLILLVFMKVLFPIVLVPVVYVVGFFLLGTIIGIITHFTGFIELFIFFWILFGFDIIWVIMMVKWKNKSFYYKLILTLVVFTLSVDAFFAYLTGLTIARSCGV